MENFQRRRQDPPILDFSEYGFGFSISSTICFDLAFPDWARLARSADLMLHPSWLWGSFMNQFLDIIAFRAVENGYNIFHCAQGGNTAVIDGYGQTRFRDVNNVNTSQLTVSVISGPRNIWTFYANIGFIFDYIVLICGCLYIVFAALLWWKKVFVIRCMVFLWIGRFVNQQDMDLIVSQKRLVKNSNSEFLDMNQTLSNDVMASPDTQSNADEYIIST